MGDLVTVSVVNTLSLEPSSSSDNVILVTNGTTCDMQAVDFDEDGDLDLILGLGGSWLRSYDQRYFERVLSELVEREQDENPLDMFKGKVHWIADVDGDGRLEVVVVGWEEIGMHYSKTRFRYFRRAADGSFVEPTENPFADITVALGEEWTFQSYVTDWNSDGLADFLVVKATFWQTWAIETYFQHVLDLDMMRDSQMDTHEDIEVQYDELNVVDWNGDGSADVVVMRDNELQLYEVNGGMVKEVLGVFENLTETLSIGSGKRDPRTRKIPGRPSLWQNFSYGVIGVILCLWLAKTCSKLWLPGVPRAQA